MRTALGLLGLGVCSCLAIYFLMTNPDISVLRSAMQLTAPKATVVATPYQTEQGWAAGEIVSDINEMARFGSAQPAAAKTDQQIVPWQVDHFTAYAATQFAGHPRPPSTLVDPPDQYRVLIDPNAEAIVKANVEVSA